MRRTFHLIALLLVIAVPLSAPAAGKASAESASAAYERGKACYRELLGPEGKAAKRAAWGSCIALFERAHAKGPKTEFAAPALFSAARLRQALFEAQHDNADIEDAIKGYNRVIHDAPDSALADDALYRVGCIRRDVLLQPDRAARAFQYLVKKYPKGDMAPVAAAALESLGTSPDAGGEREEAAAPPAEIKGAAADPKAEAKVKVPDEGERKGPSAEGKGEVVAKDAESAPAGSASAFQGATLIRMDVEPGKDVTTVKLLFTREAEYTAEYTEVGSRTQAPPRLELTLLHTAAALDLEKNRDINTAQLLSYEVRKRLLSGALRISFVLMQGSAYDIHRDKGLMTIRFGDKASLGRKEKAAPPAEKGAPAKGGRHSLRIVIDPGHGGEEDGAIGPDGLREKDVTLQIAKRVAEELRQKLHAEVFLTRADDRTLSLEQRDAVAVAKKADLFVSVHANAAENRSMSGIETYYLNNATDEAATRLAKRENQSSQKKLSQVEHIISTMLQNEDTEASRELASNVQRSLTARVSRYAKDGRVHDRGVRAALFYVLVGAKCPAILVETSFISNPREEKLLRDRTYQTSVSQAIAEGVGAYLRTRDRSMVSL
jgi:N-acetylmuramoyl-L-alanine amidase